MENVVKIFSYILMCILIMALCAWVSYASDSYESGGTEPEFEITVNGQEIKLYPEDADFIVRAVAGETSGSTRAAGKKFRGEAAPYAARIGIIATVLNRMADPRFPDSAVRVIISDKTFSDTNAAALSDYDIAITRAALESAAGGFDPTNGALYFSTPSASVNRFAVLCEMNGYSFGVPDEDVLSD